MADLNEQKIIVTPNGNPDIGIDTERVFIDDLLGAAQVGSLDLGSINALTQSTQNREQTYKLLDTMAQDDVISSVLETYTEDTVQTNDKGQVVWIEADNTRVLDYTSWLLDSLNVDKHMYQWAYCLITYGDVYLRLFRQSDVRDDKLFKPTLQSKKLNESQEKKEPTREGVNEDVSIKVYQQADKYIPYVQMVDNPGEMYDLQKFGKTHGYIKSPINVMSSTTDDLYNYLTRYKMKQSEVEIYDAMSFVHGCIENTNQRQPETIDIYLDNYKNSNDFDDDYDTDDSMTSSYNVKRGQSILYNSFKIWRELNLLEMSALLNRLTKSSIVRILNIDVGDMSKSQVERYLNRLKEKIEQKTAVNGGKGISEYTSPGPIENTIYVPTHEGKGTITATTLGGDFDPKQLTDIEYFRDKLFGSLKVPKQYFGFTADGAGFDGGKSLSILSSRYGKSVKNIQNILCQMVTDLLNLFLIDRGLDHYVNKFTVRMQEPITQEELDRRANNDTRIRYVADLMQQLDGTIDDSLVKLKIQKSLLTPVINDADVMMYIQEYIDKKEKEAEEANQSKAEEGNKAEEAPAEETEELEELPTLEKLEEPEEKEIITEEGVKDDEDEHLPSPDELEDFE